MSALKKFYSLPIEKIFLFLASIFTITSLFLIPVTTVPDEGTHAMAAWETFHQPIDKNAITDFNWLQHNQNGQPFRNSREDIESKSEGAISFRHYVNFFTHKIDLSNTKLTFSPSPFYIRYWPQALGMLVGQFVFPSYGVILTLGRLVNALIYIIGVYYLIKFIRRGKLALAAVASLPMMLHQAGSLSYDVANNLIVFTFFFFIVQLSLNRIMTLKKLGLLFLITLGLALTKANNLFLLYLLLFFDMDFDKSTGVLKSFYQFFLKYRKWIICAIFSVVVVGGLLYFRKYGGVKHIVLMLMNSMLNPQLNPDINGTMFEGIFGQFGWLEVNLPLWLIFVNLVVLVIVFLGEKASPITKMEGKAAFWVLPSQLLIIVLIMYQWALTAIGGHLNISIGTQGRYLTPYIVFYLFYVFSKRNIFQFDISENRLKSLVINTFLINFMMYVYLILIYYWV